MIDKLCVFIIAICFFVSGCVLGWKLGWKLGEVFGEAFGEQKEAEDERWA